MNATRVYPLLPILALAVGACTPFAVQTPPSFVKLERTRLPYKAVSADGVVLAVRSWPNRPKAKLSFWAKVVGDELKEQRGYKLQDSRRISVEGADGRWHRFTGEYRGDQYVYVLGLFVSEHRIYAVEGAATAELYQANKASIEQFIHSFSLK